jgi:hypothetical protein
LSGASGKSGDVRDSREEGQRVGLVVFSNWALVAVVVLSQSLLCFTLGPCASTVFERVGVSANRYVSPSTPQLGNHCSAVYSVAVLCTRYLLASLPLSVCLVTLLCRETNHNMFRHVAKEVDSDRVVCATRYRNECFLSLEPLTAPT